jgi:anti-sigma B factor antagonist
MLGIEQQLADQRLSVRVVSAHDHPEHIAVIGVHGEIDLGTAHVLREALLPVLVDESGPVVLDLSEVGFMDSTGVHVLVDTFEHLSQETRPLTIACREGSQVHRVLGLVGLLDTLTVYHSRRPAKAS